MGQESGAEGAGAGACIMRSVFLTCAVAMFEASALRRFLIGTRSRATWNGEVRQTAGMRLQRL